MYKALNRCALNSKSWLHPWLPVNSVAIACTNHWYFKSGLPMIRLCILLENQPWIIYITFPCSSYRTWFKYCTLTCAHLLFTLRPLHMHVIWQARVCVCLCTVALFAGTTHVTQHWRTGKSRKYTFGPNNSVVVLPQSSLPQLVRHWVNKQRCWYSQQNISSVRTHFAYWEQNEDYRFLLGTIFCKLCRFFLS
jgi:hypothetical protein